MSESLIKSVAFVIIVSISLNCQAKSEPLPSIGDSTSNNGHLQPSRWDMNTIYHPSQALLEREKQGHINIYDGFKDSEVNTILDDNFNRIQNMMFTRVKITDDYGSVMIDPVSGSEVVADDGCED